MDVVPLDQLSIVIPYLLETLQTESPAFTVYFVPEAVLEELELDEFEPLVLPVFAPVLEEPPFDTIRLLSWINKIILDIVPFNQLSHRNSVVI